MPSSVYIHIPFCKSKCKYCSFVSFCRPEMIQKYISALEREIVDNYKDESLKTLYFGGGTPSLLSADDLGKIVNKFKLECGCEVTLEVNPDDVTENYLKSIREMGVNRLSIGSQTFDDEILKLIGRRHGSEEIKKAINMAKGAGFKNISVDLIYGLPKQTLDGVKRDLEKFLALDIQHISTYGLKIEEGSYFYEHNPPNLPDEDLQADMYEFINNFLESNGFQRYEVSNFAKAGFESKHNLNYWNNSEYYGFGAAAHGYVDGVRYSNKCSLEEYLKAPMEYSHRLTNKEKLEEEIFLGFRKTEGINTAKIKEKFGVDFEQKYADTLERYAKYFEKTQSGYTLNLQGVLISNIILADFL